MIVVIGLFVVGLAAVIAELFLPTLGIVGVIGGGSIIAAVVVAFRTLGRTAGSVVLLAALVLAPVVVLVFFRLFPRTFVGRRLILGSREGSEAGFTAHTASRYADLAGRSGVVVTALRPAGTVLIDGRRVDAVSSGEYLEVGARVRVLRVEGNRVSVGADRPRRQS